MKPDDRPPAQSPDPPKLKPFGIDDIVRAYADRIVEGEVLAVYASRPQVEAYVREAIQDALDRKTTHDAATAREGE
jgi:hypothetical protein